MDPLSFELNISTVEYLETNFKLYNDITMILNSYLQYKINKKDYNKLISTTFHFNIWAKNIKDETEYKIINNAITINIKKTDKHTCGIHFRDLLYCKYFKVSDISHIILEKVIYFPWYGEYYKIVDTSNIGKHDINYKPLYDVPVTPYIMMRYNKLFTTYIIEKFKYIDYYKPYDIDQTHLVYFCCRKIFTTHQLKHILYKTEHLTYDKIFQQFGPNNMSLFNYLSVNPLYLDIVIDIINNPNFDNKHLFDELWDIEENKLFPESNLLMILCYRMPKIVDKLLHDNKITQKDMNTNFNDLTPNDIINF